MTDEQWVETPMFIMRRDCVNFATSGWRPGSFIEMGAGTGRLTRSFFDRGFSGTCYDLGDDNRETLRRNLGHYGDRLRVVDALDDAELEAFDYLFAFEVLEHIEDDAQALEIWLRYLKPGGRLLISVPAHMRKFGPNDQAVGHVRRYERAQLVDLLGQATKSTVEVYCYGFPLAAATRTGSEILSARRRDGAASDGPTKTELSILSGTVSSKNSRRAAKVLNRHTLVPFVLLQRLFFGTDLGDGFVAHCVKN